jgi:hypothetical protein
MSIALAAGLSCKREMRDGCKVEWQDPPIMRGRWVAYVTSDNRRLWALMGCTTQMVISRSRDEMRDATRVYIDGLLRRLPCRLIDHP